MTFFRHVIFVTFWSPLTRPKRRPRGPKTPPRASQEAPRGRQERPRRLQEGLKSAQGGSKKASRAAKLHPRCLAKMPCRELTNGHAESSRAGGGVPPKGKAIRRHPKGRSVSERISNCLSIFHNKAWPRAFRTGRFTQFPGPPSSIQNRSKN